MPYCEVEDIEADFKALEIDDSTTSVSEDEITEIIDQESNYIDGRVGLKYVTPIDPDESPKAFSILKRICTFMCAERVKSILEVKTGVAQLDSEQKVIMADTIRTFKKDLQLISEGKLLLSDATLKSTSAGVSSFNSSNCIGHVIDVTKQQW